MILFGLLGVAYIVACVYKAHALL